MKQKNTMNTPKPKPKTARFWAIDTDGHSARGPYKTQSEAEAELIEEIRALWMDSCNCLTSDKTQKWCSPYHIVEVIRTVQPEITPNIALEDVKP